MALVLLLCRKDTDSWVGRVHLLPLSLIILIFTLYVCFFHFCRALRERRNDRRGSVLHA